MSGGSGGGDMPSHWSLVVNLANSIVGVSVLAMPFVMHQCGLVLGVALIVASGYLTKLTCGLLVRAAHSAKRRSYEQLALRAYGPTGKLFLEIMLVSFLMSTLCAFLVVIGDLGPASSEHFARWGRVPVMVFIAITVVLPLSLLRNLDSLTVVCSLSIIFYCFFILRLFFLALPTLLQFDWISQIRLVRWVGLLRCAPIVALALSCQTQVFALSQCANDATGSPVLAPPQPHVMDSVVLRAVNLCQLMYTAVGSLGYIAFYEQGAIAGDVLLLLPEQSALTPLIRLGFLLSVAVSFPLMLFPCRAALYAMLFHKLHGGSSELSAGADLEYMPDGPFRLLTAGLIAFNLVTAVYIPNVEFVLGLSGSLVGSVVCVMFPAALFLKLGAPMHQKIVPAAQFALVAGGCILVACTYATLSADSPPPHEPLLHGLSAEPQQMQQVDSVRLHNDTVHVDSNAAQLVAARDAGEGAAALAERAQVQAQADADNVQPKAGDQVRLQNEPTLAPVNVERHEPPLPQSDLGKQQQRQPQRNAEVKDAKRSVEQNQQQQVQQPPPEDEPKEHVQQQVADAADINVQHPPKTNPPVQPLKQDALPPVDRKTTKSDVLVDDTKTTVLADAKELIQELQKQRVVQDNLIEQQKEILNQLKQHQKQEETGDAKQDAPLSAQLQGATGERRADKVVFEKNEQPIKRDNHPERKPPSLQLNKAKIEKKSRDP